MNIWTFDIILYTFIGLMFLATLFCVPMIRGKLGERYIIKHLKSLPSDSYQVINDVIIPENLD